MPSKEVTTEVTIEPSTWTRHVLQQCNQAGILLRTAHAMRAHKQRSHVSPLQKHGIHVSTLHSLGTLHSLENIRLSIQKTSGRVRRGVQIPPPSLQLILNAECTWSGSRRREPRQRFRNPQFSIRPKGDVLLAVPVVAAELIVDQNGLRKVLSPRSPTRKHLDSLTAG